MNSDPLALALGIMAAMPPAPDGKPKKRYRYPTPEETRELIRAQRLAKVNARGGLTGKQLRKKRKKALKERCENG